MGDIHILFDRFLSRPTHRPTQCPSFACLPPQVGPGGACFPLGRNESIEQAKEIIQSYNQLTPSTGPAITELDLLLVHWPVNYGPCSVPAGHKTIPTTDLACDAALPSYDERTCRISTWRGMVELWKAGLSRSIGVSNWNSTEMQVSAI
jgi:aryl-alcohol dehydrogenase-like predicted oxidoreductase